MLFSSLSNSASTKIEYQLQSLDLCHEQLSRSMLSRNLIQLFFSKEFTLKFNLKNWQNPTPSSAIGQNGLDCSQINFNDSFALGETSPLRNSNKARSPLQPIKEINNSLMDESFSPSPKSKDKTNDQTKSKGAEGLDPHSLTPPHIWTLLLKKL